MVVRPPPTPPVSRADVSAYTRQSRTYEPGDPELRTKRIARFRYTDLERIPREHADLHKALFRLLPEAAFEPGFLRQVQQVLHKHTEMDIDLWLQSVRMLKRTDLRALIPGTTCLVIVGLAPLNEKLILEIDLRFAYRAVEKLLGGHGNAVDLHRPLSELEQGVFSYLVLKVLQLVQGQLASAEQVAVRLEDIRSDLRSMAEIIRNHDYWVCAAYKMNFDLDVAYVRALVPSTLPRHLVEEEPSPDSPLAERIRGRIRERMGRLAGLSVEGRVQVGHIELLPEDLQTLDPGDIILLDQTKAQLTDGEVQGAALMTLGSGQRGLLHGEVRAEDTPAGRQLVFQLNQIEIRPAPSVHDPQLAHGEPGNPEEVMAEYEDGSANDDGAQTALDDREEDWGVDDRNEGDDEDYGDGVPVEDDDNLAESAPLLGDIPVNVVVELGRVSLTADEVIRLRPGQILELGRTPNDPVDLVVANKLIAKGELVQIEGALGVKILSLVKDSE